MPLHVGDQCCYVAGLSVAKIESIDGNCLVVSGADLVDGTPVLDIKPYLPFCDSWPAASCPAWVSPHEIMCMFAYQMCIIKQAGCAPAQALVCEFLVLPHRLLVRSES